MPASYERPQLFLIGTVETATWAGNDPCRYNPPRGFKQTGPRDYVQASAAVQDCEPISNASP